MGTRAGVTDVAAAVHVFVVPDRRVGPRPVAATELRKRHTGDAAPEVLRRIQIEPLVQVYANPKSFLVDIEEPAQPGAEACDHAIVGVCERKAAGALRA